MSQEIANRPRLLLVDGDETLLRQLQWGLDDLYEIAMARSAPEALNQVRTFRPALVTLDLSLTQYGSIDDGFQVLDEMLAFDRGLKVILVTGNDTREEALKAIDRGAFDFLSRPIELAELRILLRRAARHRALEEENARLQEHLRQAGGLGGIQGSSEPIQKVFQMIRRVAATDVTVLIGGEGGTGKELVAREIHRLSPRSGRSFISIACGAIPEALLDAELFGQEQGLFAGAPAGREGKLEMAQGGTVYLDEIGEMPAALQVRLLRFLQEREIERVGGRRAIPLDVRVLAATNRDLKREVEKGRFREDLFFRLSVVHIQVPSLRDRRDDILFLARHFLNRFSQEYHRGPLHFSRESLRQLQRYEWPGNVRELEHRIQRAVVMSTGRTVRPNDLDLAGAPAVPVAPLRTVREQAERQLLVESLKRNCGNITRSARELAVSRPTYHDLLKKYRLRAGDYKNGHGPE